MGWEARSIKAPKLPDPPEPLPQEEAERSVEAPERALPVLMKLDCYEARAASRRMRAIEYLNNFKLAQSG
jgi:hypothetical protein